MEYLNKKYYINLEIISPTHIGAGKEKDWIKGADFIVHDNKVKIINLKNLSKLLNVTDLSNALLNRNNEEFQRKLGNKINECVDKVFSDNYFGNNDIKTLIKNQRTGNPIIPGSSLKGAIRSILFKHLGGNSRDGSEVFGSSILGDEFMRFIKFADTEFNQSELVNSKIFNLRRDGNQFVGGWKHGSDNTSEGFQKEGFNTFYEALMPNQKAYTSISISELGYKNFEKKSNNRHNIGDKKKPIVENKIDYLFKIINEHTKKYIGKQIDFFNKYSTDETPKIIENLNKVLQQIPDDNSSCVLKMAAGSGFHSITGDWQHRTDFSINGIDNTRRVSQGTFNGIKSSKSRKIAVYKNNFYLMGFVKLSVVEESEIEEQKKLINEQPEQIRFETVENNQTQQAVEERPIEPEVKDFNGLRDGDTVYAKVIGQIENNCRVELFVENLDNKIKEFRFPAGFETNTVILCSINFPNRRNRDQFSLAYRKTITKP